MKGFISKFNRYGEEGMEIIITIARGEDMVIPIDEEVEIRLIKDEEKRTKDG